MLHHLVSSLTKAPVKTVRDDSNFILKERIINRLTPRKVREFLTVLCTGGHTSHKAKCPYQDFVINTLVHLG